MKKTENSKLSAHDYLINLFCESENEAEISQLLEALMTEKEQRELLNRLKIFAYLQQGVSQREISAKLGVGIATVSRGAKAFREYPIETLLPNLSKIISP